MRYDPEHTYKNGECWWSEQELALRPGRSLTEDVVPSAVPRPVEPPVPLRQRGSPGAPELEEGQAEMEPAEPPAAPIPGVEDAVYSDGEALDEQDIFRDLPGEFPQTADFPPGAYGEDVPAADGEAAPARRRSRRQVVEQGTQATDEWDRPDWTRFALGRALKVLRTGSDGEVKRVLQRLHIRHYHQTAEQMHELLAAAGMSERVLKLIEPVVKGCRVCRMWARPGQKAAAATRLTTRFNDLLQGDLLFTFDLAVLHLVDEATRWSSVGTLACLLYTSDAADE